MSVDCAQQVHYVGRHMLINTAVEEQGSNPGTTLQEKEHHAQVCMLHVVAWCTLNSPKMSLWLAVVKLAEPRLRFPARLTWNHPNLAWLSSWNMPSWTVSGSPLSVSHIAEQWRGTFV